MAEASKTSFLGSISSWARTSTPPPRSPRQQPLAAQDEVLKPSSGLDHTLNFKPSPSLSRYPKDCPALRAKWFYAVDVPKRKPFARPDLDDKDQPKAPPAPKKLVPFSTSDSNAIETAYQGLDKGTNSGDELETTSTRVPVNEDYLFDVHIEKRELEPAYWLGPVYEVKRGSWFYQIGATVLVPCNENLANQLEEGYLKLTPWRRAKAASRSSSQPRSRPVSLLAEGTSPEKAPSSANPGESLSTTNSGASTSYRLFGAYMNTTVTYMDATVAYLSQDDFMSRVSSTVYERFGVYSGTKVVRGWTEQSKTTQEAKQSDVKEHQPSKLSDVEDARNEDDEPSKPPKRNALERQLSSLAGLAEEGDSEADAQKEADEEQAREMEDAREKDGDDQSRPIDHLVLVTHGIGQRLGLRLDSINFVHDVNTMRKTMKAVYESAPDLQAIGGDSKNCRVQVLPICWRHLLDFPRQSLKNGKKEFDLGDIDAALDEEYPSLQDITVEGVPAVRGLIQDLALDILLYQSAYREHIASIVQKECNRVFQLFRKRTGFSGSVSLCGHSLGSAILFDILCRQEEEHVNTRPRRASSKTSRDAGVENETLQLDFLCDNFFAIGSPIALFQMLKGRTVAGRKILGNEEVVTSPFDPDSMVNDPFDTRAGKLVPTNKSSGLIPMSQSKPKCSDLFNIFHPTDPIAYRIEPLISPAMAQLKPQPLPYTKKGLFGAPGIANISQRVGQQVMSGWYNLTSGVASNLINRSLGITGEEQALPQDKIRPLPGSEANSRDSTTRGVVAPVADGKKQQDLADRAKTSNSDRVPTLIDTEIETLYAGFQKRRRSHASATSEDPSGADHDLEQEKVRRLKREEAKVKALNQNGRVDFSIQEGMFDVSLLASIASHLSYWADEDVNHFIMGQMLKKGKPEGGK